MTSRERIIKAINHQLPDRVPRDLGTTLVTGMHASAYAKLKQALGITDGHVRVYDPFQILAEVESPVRRALKIDTIGIQLPKTVFGYKNEKWKPFRLFDGTEVLVSKHFEFDTLDNGDIVQYPRGDRSVPPSAKMPKDGYYFDVLVRQEPFVDSELDARDWAEQSYRVYSEEDLDYLEETSKVYFENTDYALIGNFGGAAFSNIAYVPGPHLAYPRGIRDPEQWLMSMITRKQYIRDVHRYQFEIQMQNLKLYHQAVGERIQVIYMSGTDFGAQEGPFISPLLFRELFKPFLKQMNDWVHANTTWKTFYHTCGSVVDFLEDFIEAGFDILNPVQISARGMDPQFLKSEYGDRLVFWGGGVNTQHTLPFATPEEVRSEVQRNVEIFSRGGGYVFTPVHNIQANVPVENILALFD
jgi:uroporphyrinogen-III decarboxylase